MPEAEEKSETATTAARSTYNARIFSSAEDDAPLLSDKINQRIQRLGCAVLAKADQKNCRLLLVPHTCAHTRRSCSRLLDSRVTSGAWPWRRASSSRRSDRTSCMLSPMASAGAEEWWLAGWRCVGVVPSVIAGSDRWSGQKVA